MRGKGFNIPKSGGGPEHEYWKYIIAEQFKEKGYTVEFEVQINGHCADLVAKKDEENIAVEVETGKSDAISNITQDLQAEFKQVACFVLSQTQLEKLSSYFAKELQGGRLAIYKSIWI
jgi:predicted RecB family endonuclease